MSSVIKRRQMGDEMSLHKEISTSRDREVMKHLSVCRERKPSDTDGATSKVERGASAGEGVVARAEPSFRARLRNLVLILYGILEVGE